ncbi:MAG: M48 metallopeptidase family protein [Kineosporiaceae bacterium]
MGAGPIPSVPPGVDVRRSRRRLRTVTAYREGDRTVVLIPARFTVEQEQEWVRRMLARLSAQDRRRRPGDADLAARAVELSRRYLGGLAQPASVAWAANQNSRWGSCTPADRSIRLSTRLQGMPSWVIDYVLLHELAHLVEQGHGPRFWSLLEPYPRTERARGFLEGFAAARHLHMSDGGHADELAEDVDATAVYAEAELAADAEVAADADADAVEDDGPAEADGIASG